MNPGVHFTPVSGVQFDRNFHAGPYNIFQGVNAMFLAQIPPPAQKIVESSTTRSLTSIPSIPSTTDH